MIHKKRLFPILHSRKMDDVGWINWVNRTHLGKAVAESIAKCKNAGIKVIMIIGDYAVTATATAIATDIGICEPGVLCYERVQLNCK